MSLSKGTPLSSQIIWLENRVKELEEENDKLNQICLEQKNDLVSIRRSQYFKENEKLKLDIAGYKNRIDILQSEKKILHNLNVAAEKKSDASTDLMIGLDARYKNYVNEFYIEKNEGHYTSRRSASIKLIEELVDEVIKSSYDDNQVKLAFAIELLKRSYP